MLVSGVRGMLSRVTALVAIACDRCGDIGWPVGTTPQLTRAALPGWSRSNGLDVCPLCHVVRGSSQQSSQEIQEAGSEAG